MKDKTENKRMIPFDLLRILAAFSVVMLHSAAQFWYTLDIQTPQWLVANSYDAAFRFGVPIFVMISGALFLNPGYSLDVKKLYKHNILRFMVIYLLWSCLYGLWDIRGLSLADISWKDCVREMLYGRYHLWFLPMIIGIYMLLPILKGWLQNAGKKEVQYFLVLFLIFQIGTETLRALTVTEELHYLLDVFRPEMVCGYLGYFIWGYYLFHVGVEKKVRRYVYFAAVPALVCNVVLGNLLALHRGQAVGSLYDSFGVFTFLIVTALFLGAQEFLATRQWKAGSRKVIGELAADTLGVYLVHIGLMEGLKSFGIHSMTLPIVVGIPVHAFFCFGLGILLAALLRRIPLVGKYIC